MPEPLRDLLKLGTDEHPNTPLLRELSELAGRGDLNRANVAAIVDRDTQKRFLQDAYLACVGAALIDHALTSEELFALRLLRTATGIEERELFTERRSDGYTRP